MFYQIFLTEEKTLIVSGPLLYAPRNLFSSNVHVRSSTTFIFQGCLNSLEDFEKQAWCILTRLGNGKYFKNSLEAKRILKHNSSYMISLNLCKAALLHGFNQRSYTEISYTEIMKISDKSRMGTRGKFCGRKALF